MSPSNFPQGKLSCNIQPWNPSQGKKSLPISRPLPQAHCWAVDPCRGLATYNRGAGRAEEPWGMANCPQASPSPLTRRLQAENQFPSVCPDIPSALRLFTAEQCCAFTIELRGAETHREATALVLFHGVQPVTTAISWRAHFSNPHLFGNPDYHYFITKRHRLKEV